MTQLPSKCPHSSAPGADPRKCSLCVAGATGQVPKKITIDPDQGLMMDGQPIKRSTDAPEVAHVSPPNTGKSRRGGRRAPTCSRCGSTAHKAPKCDGSGLRKITEVGA